MVHCVSVFCECEYIGCCSSDAPRERSKGGGAADDTQSCRKSKVIALVAEEARGTPWVFESGTCRGK